MRSGGRDDNSIVRRSAFRAEVAVAVQHRDISITEALEPFRSVLRERLDDFDRPDVLGGELASAVGSSPTRKVQRPMIVIVRRKVYFRPIRSPIRPKTMAPNGRTTKPMANVARNAIRSPSVVPV